MALSRAGAGSGKERDSGHSDLTPGVAPGRVRRSEQEKQDVALKSDFLKSYQLV